MTTEWMLKTSENSIKYTVVVANFRKKINSFKYGRSIWSKDFKVGRTVFYLGIKPSGEESSSSHVGVYLYNKSDWDVIADVKFEVADCKRELEKERFGRREAENEAWGFEMVPHHRCTNGDILSEGSFQLEVYIEVDDEQVLPHHDLEDEVISKIRSHVDKKFEEIENKIEKTFSRMEQRMASFENGNSLLMTRLDAIGRKIFNQPPGDFNSNSSTNLECPVCAETVRRPMRLYQCGQVGSKYCCQFLTRLFICLKHAGPHHLR